MNQILVINIEFKKKTKYKKILKIQFMFSIFLTISLLLYNGFSIYKKNKNDEISKQLISNFNISFLYSDSNLPIASNFYSASNSPDVFSVIGVIEIKKLKINYPIISPISDEFLKISPCKFYGPNPNEIGNFCIAGHNYNDNRFFSKIGTLKYGDIINIVDLSGRKIEYYVTENYETYADDTTCTSQDTNGQKEITLVTCNNFTGTRIIVKAENSI